jgi:hypothetical protein
MASFVYDKAVNAAWRGLIDLLTADIRFQVVNNTYVASKTTHEFFSSVGAGARVTGGFSPALAGKALTGLIFTATDPIFPSVDGAGTSPVAVVLLVWTGVDATSRLLLYADDVIAIRDPAGSQVTLLVNEGPDGIASL